MPGTQDEVGSEGMQAYSQEEVSRMAKRRAGSYAKCVGKYLKGHHGGSPQSRMKAAAAICKKGGTTRRRRKHRR